MASLESPYLEFYLYGRINVMVKFGNWIFHYRNFLFPVFYLLLFIPSPEIFSSWWTAIIAGLIIAFTGEFIRALVMGLVDILHGGKDRTIYSSALITDGIFSHCRNPLYIGNILILLGLGVMANSLIFILVMIPLFIFFYQAIVMAEEDFLTRNFGDAYKEYQSRVNRWLPNLSGLGKTFSSRRFSLQRVLVKEYNSTYLWMSGAVLLLMKQYCTHPTAEALPSLLPIFIALLIFLLLCYLFIRYMKKSKRWTAD